MQTYYPILSVSHPEIKKKGTCTHSFNFFVLFLFLAILFYFIFFQLSQDLRYWEKRNEKML